MINVDTDMLYHTSPQEIKEINPFGTFGDVLFFASSPYYMTQSPNTVVYELDDSELEFLSVDRLYYEDLENSEALKSFINLYSFVAEDPESWISEKLGIWSDCDEIDNEEKAEFSWRLQQVQAEIAKELGYFGVEGEDEQGIVWYACMSGKESLLAISDER